MILSTHGIVSSQIQSFVGLLDTYPNAAAAYSVRRLRGGYTGSAIRVRRSSDNAESDIGFTANGKLDTTFLTSFCGSSNGFVTTWYDQSGNSRNATQTTAAQQPQIVSSGTVITNIGSEPTLKFNGNQWINNTSTFTILQPFSNFSVCKFSSFTSPTNFPYIWRSELGNDANLVLMGYLNQYRIYAGGNLNSTLSASNNSLLFYGIYNGSNSIVGLNTTTNTGNPGGNGLINGISFGTYDTSSGQLNGFISESIFYPSNQTSNVSGINTNINTYYGIY